MIFCERGREGRRKGHERLRVFCNKLLFVMHVLSLRLGNPLGSSNQTIRIHGKEICEFLCAMNKARVKAEKKIWTALRVQVHRATIIADKQPQTWSHSDRFESRTEIKPMTTTSTTPATTTVESTTELTTVKSTTLRSTTRKQIYTSSTPITTTHADSSSEDLEMEFVTDFPGSNSLFYPGVESYQHHINYINSQVSLHEKFHLHWLSVSVLVVLKTSWCLWLSRYKLY